MMLLYRQSKGGGWKGCTYGDVPVILILLGVGILDHFGGFSSAQVANKGMVRFSEGFPTEKKRGPFLSRLGGCSNQLQAAIAKLNGLNTDLKRIEESLFPGFAAGSQWAHLMHLEIRG